MIAMEAVEAIKQTRMRCQYIQEMCGKIFVHPNKCFVNTLSGIILGEIAA